MNRLFFAWILSLLVLDTCLLDFCKHVLKCLNFIICHFLVSFKERMCETWNCDLCCRLRFCRLRWLLLLLNNSFLHRSVLVFLVILIFILLIVNLVGHVMIGSYPFNWILDWHRLSKVTLRIRLNYVLLSHCLITWCSNYLICLVLLLIDKVLIWFLILRLVLRLSPDIGLRRA